MTSIKLIGFDLDDCLFNSTGLSEAARIKGIEAMIKLGLDIDRDLAITLIQEIVNEYGSNSSQHYNYFIRRINELDIHPISLNKENFYIAAAVMAYHKEKIDSITLYNDVKPCLKELRKLGIKTVIISDGLPIKQYEKILRLKIDKLVDSIVITDEIGVRKPNPKLFSYFLKKFDVKGSETIYVGDNIHKDIIPAKKNNIYSIFIHRGGKYDTSITGLKIPDNLKPDYEIDNLNELFPIIEKINRQS